MTHLEKMKQMNGKEIAQFILEHSICHLCLYYNTQLCETAEGLERCKEGISAYFNSEVEE